MIKFHFIRHGSMFEEVKYFWDNYEYDVWFNDMKEHFSYSYTEVVVH